MILNALGEQFTNEFKGCGHQAIATVEGGKAILDQLESGEAKSVKAGLHSLAGHAKSEISGTIPRQFDALVNVATGVAQGHFGVDSHGSLLAGSQFKAAKLAKEAGVPVAVESILKVYETGAKSQRASEHQKFRSWMVGTSIAALRESQAPQAAETLLKEILADQDLQQELNLSAPSQLRQVVVLAAPKLCMPVLFLCYERCIQFGGPEEQGLALLNVAQLPGAVKALGVTHNSRPILLDWCNRYAQALEGIIDTCQFPLPNPQKPETPFSKEVVARVISALKGT
jgi:hypothetical protein